MVIAWIGYCLLVSASLGIAALAAERALGHYRKPVRWVWAGAIAGSLILPIAAYVAPALLARFSSVTTSLSGTVVSLPELASAAAGADATGAFDTAALLGAIGTGVGFLWIASIAGLGGYLFLAHRRLHDRMREWTPGRILDAPVLMSEDTGPAVIGLRKGTIVMPAWIAELEKEVLRLVFLHEREHQRAGDHRLFLAGLAGVVAMPWNPFAWWQLRRLRLAIEYDCDRRVIARGVSPRDYAEALLTVGTRASRMPLAAAAFAERKSAVERRLRRLTEPLRRLRGPRAALAAGIGALGLAFACGSPLPTDLSSFDAAEPDQIVVVAKESGDLSSRPMFIPYDRRPVLRNAEEVRTRLAELYPAALRDAGIGGRVELWIFVSETGEVTATVLKTRSGHEALDRAAAEVAGSMRFSPAVNRDEPTPVWVQQWISFEGQPESDEKKHEATQVSGDPLIVIDGVIQARKMGIDDVNALEIDHIEIIKGPAARELYGPRASDGVVNITTKARPDAAGVSELRPLPDADKVPPVPGDQVLSVPGDDRSTAPGDMLPKVQPDS